MPVVRYKDKICHFAHIPKCGGSSVEFYLKRIGAHVAFLDHSFLSSAKLWNISSPQHVDGNSLSRLFPNSFFDFSFAVVRNPYTRFVSAFKFQMLVHKTIKPGLDINHFVEHELESVAGEIGMFDNHFLTQTSFFLPYQHYDIYKIENGLEQVKQYLDSNLVGMNLKDPIGHQNKSLVSGTQFTLSVTSKDILQKVYRQDFEKFSY